MTRGGHFDSEVLALVAQALKLDPEHPKALLIASTAAFQRKDYREAAAILERLQQLLPADSQFAALAGERLAQARAHLGVASAAPAATSAAPVAPQAAGPTIRGRVELSAALAGKAAPADTVFILARAPQGSRMPLAILRRQVKDLPFDFTLSDEQAMSPAMKLSAFSEVVVVARVSKSGNAASQSGDLLGSTAAIKVGAAGIKVLIDSSVP
jgi:cytochrome c-type biogenesis protein CcmH